PTAFIDAKAPPGGRVEKLPEEVVGVLRYRNASWELTLMLEPIRGRRGKLRISAHSTIENVHSSGRTQALANPRTNPPKGIRFKLTQAGEDPFILEVAGEPLPKDAKADFKNVRGIDRFDRFDFTKPFAIEQLYDWNNSPVRRVENLALA